MCVVRLEMKWAGQGLACALRAVHHFLPSFSLVFCSLQWCECRQATDYDPATSCGTCSRRVCIAQHNRTIDLAELRCLRWSFFQVHQHARTRAPHTTWHANMTPLHTHHTHYTQQSKCKHLLFFAACEQVQRKAQFITIARMHVVQHEQPR